MELYIQPGQVLKRIEPVEKRKEQKPEWIPNRSQTRLQCVNLVNGYYDKAGTDITDVTDVIVSYLGCMRFTFDFSAKEHKGCIAESGTMFERKHREFATQVGVRKSMPPQPIYQNDIFLVGSDSFLVPGTIKQCHIKILQGYWTLTYYVADKGHYRDGFGVATAEVKQMALNHPENKYFDVDELKQLQEKKEIYCFGLREERSMNKVFADPDDAQKNGWEQGDIITVELNCKDWTITFRKNNQKILKWCKVKPNAVYYPIIFSINCGTKYQIS
eukprot:601706_1